jgi:hypothetical protein
MPRRTTTEAVHQVSDDIDARIYRRPSTELVARIWDSCGPENACERWYWLGRWALERMATDGRRMRRAASGATVRGACRATTPEQEDAAFRAIQAHGVHRAQRVTGLGATVLYRILRERGVTQAPRLSGEERGRATREGIARVRAERVRAAA